MPTPPLLALHDVHYRYADGSGGLAGCSLHIAAGSRNALLGANGSGKTTLLMQAIGLLRPQAGQLEFAGQPLDYRRAGLDALRRRVGLVFQNPDRQLFAATVAEDVSYGPLNLDLPEAVVRRRVAESLAAVGLADHADCPLHQLSFGQKKRVCIAGVLAMQPELLLLDEPMAGLDAAMQAELMEILDTLSAQGITIVLSTHDVDFAYRWADAIHVLAAGRCTASFASDALAAHAPALLAAGQPLPGVLALHAELQRLGLLTHGHAPRSLPSLLAQLAKEPSACKNP